MSHTKTENTPINSEDMETRKNLVDGQKESCVQYIKKGTPNNAIITEGYPY